MLNQQKEKLWISVSEKSENMICKIINDTIIDWYGMFYLIIYFLFECSTCLWTTFIKKALGRPLFKGFVEDLMECWILF